MRCSSLLVLAVLAAAPAVLAAPPSSSLSGDEGRLTWAVSSTDGGLLIEGRSPKWTVRHEAGPGIEPRRTVRSDDQGNTVTVEYTAEGATVVLPDKTVVVEQQDLWDGDTLDVRLGALVSAGTTTADFSALDTASAKVYRFQARGQGAERCGDVPCTHVRVTLSGLLKAVGPKWHYWFAADGELLRFEGPIGTFTKES